MTGQNPPARRERMAITTETDTIKTPGGTITVLLDEVVDEYPGAAIEIDGVMAAVVEWHTERQCFVLRTYTAHSDTPHHYHQWDGTEI